MGADLGAAPAAMSHEGIDRIDEFFEERDGLDKAIVIAIVTTLLLAAVTALGQVRALKRHDAAVSQADQWVDVGGYKLGVHCEGEGSPAVILDAGGGGNSGTWRKVQPSVAKFTRVCSYDRAGLANSEDRLDKDVDGGFVADELARMLDGP